MDQADLARLPDLPRPCPWSTGVVTWGHWHPLSNVRCYASMNRKVFLLAGVLVAAAASWLAAAAEEANPAEASIVQQSALLESQTKYLISLRREAELVGRQKLLQELNVSHTARGEAASKSGQVELTRWEEGLAREYSERAERLDLVIAEVAKERAGFEAVKPLPETANNRDSAIYLSRLDERTREVQQQITALAELGVLSTQQLQTNNTPEHVARVSEQLDNYTREQKWLRRELGDLELKKLEFRALLSRP